MSSVLEMHAPQEEDRLPAKLLALIGTTAVFVTVVGIWIAYAMLPEPTPEASAAAASPTERFGYDPSPIEKYERAQDFYAPQRERLQSYGAVDEQQNLVRIPLDRAMELYLERRQAR